MKLYLFLRSIVWTAVISVAFSIAAVITAFTAPALATPFALVAIALGVLSPRRVD